MECPRTAVQLVGETTLSELKTRPDFAVTVGKALVGFIEVKAPGKGADPRQFNDPHDKDQWNKLKSLPNLIYTDGNSFSLWRDGKPESAIVHLKGNVEIVGCKTRRARQRCFRSSAIFCGGRLFHPRPPNNSPRSALAFADYCVMRSSNR